MAKIQLGDKKLIDSLNLLISFSDEKEKIVRMTCKNTILTDEFMNSFGRFLDKDSFSSSPYLSGELAEKNANLFDIDTVSKSDNISFSMIRGFHA